MIESRRLASNIMVGWIANLVKVIVQLIMLPLMARFLGPAEMGLYTLAMPVIALVMPLTDAGLGQSLAREKLDNHPVWSTAFWFLLAISFVLSASIVGGGYVIALMANQPRLPLVMIALAFVFPMVALGVLPNARLTQKGRLRVGPLIDMSANVLGAGIGAYCAFSKWGVWAMVAQYTSVFVFRTSIFNIVEFYLPRFIFNMRVLGGHMQLGGAITSCKLIEFGGRVLENSLISRFLGSDALGTYGFATQVSRFLSEAVSNSMWANLYYSALYGDEEATVKALMKLTRVLGLILLPGSCLAAALAPTVLPILLGHKWALAGWPLAVLCVSSPYVVIGNMTAAVLFAKGKGKIPLWTSAITTIGRLVALLVFTQFGIVAACAAVSVVSVGQYFCSFLVTEKAIGHGAFAVFRNMIWPIVLSLVGFVVSLLILLKYSGLPGEVLAVAAFAVVYVLGQCVFDRALFVGDVVGFAKLAARKSARTSAEAAG